MTDRSRWGSRWAAGLALAVSFAVAFAACRSEPTPRARGSAQGARGAGYGRASAAISPTVCSDMLRRGGLPVGDAPRKGSPDAVVAIVEFANLDCAECRTATDTVNQILAAHPDDVALYYVQVPGSTPGPAWRNAAEAALAADRNGKFWEFVARVESDPAKLTPPDFDAHARDLGIDLSGFRTSIRSPEVRATVDAGVALATELGVTGPLPVFWVNGELVQASDVARLRQVVDQKVNEAYDLLAAPRSRCEVLARFVSSRQAGAGTAAQPAAPQAPPPRPQEDPNALYKVPLADSPIRGAKEALVTLIMFKDFECPPCRGSVATLHALLEQFPDDLRLVFKHNPLPMHPNAPLAAEAAAAAHAQGKFWDYYEKLFANQRALGRADLERYAQEIGLDMGAFRQALDNHTYQATVEQDIELARRFNVTGTPTFIMNGRKTPNLPIEAFRARVEQELARARALVEAGTPRGHVYDKIVAAGSDRVVFLPTPPQAAEKGAPQPPPPLPDQASDVKVEAWNPTRGNPNAPVTIVVFCEYLCPFCNRLQGTLRQIEAAYGNRVRIVFRNNIVHEPARPLSLAALAAAKQGKFQQLHDLFFQNFGQVREQAAIEQMATQAGLDMDRFRADMQSDEILKQLEADAAEAARLGVRGTPNSFINGRLMVGARPPSDFGAWIDKLLNIPGPTIPPSADPPIAGGGGCGQPTPPAPAPAPVVQPMPIVQPAPIAQPTPPASAPPPARTARPEPSRRERPAAAEERHRRRHEEAAPARAPRTERETEGIAAENPYK